MRPLSRFVVGLATLLFAASEGFAAPYAYVPNVESANVSVIDTATNTVVSTIPTGQYAAAVAVNADGTRAYVAWSAFTVIDTATNNATPAVPLTGFLQGIAVNAAGTRAYVVNQEPSSVIVLDTANNSIVATAALGGRNPIGIDVNPAGTRAYVAHAFSNSVSVVDTLTNTEIGSVAVGLEPVGVAVNPAGTRVYVPNRRSDSVSVIDTASNTVVANITGCAGPAGVAVNAAGTRVYVSNQGGNSVAIIDTASNTVVATVPVGKSPTGIAIDPTGTRVFVANALSNSVSVIDTGSKAVVATVAVGKVPIALGRFIKSAVSPPAAATKVIEFYHAMLDHYFITWMPGEIAILDAGTQIKGWTRTGYSFTTYTSSRTGTSPVCRYYIPPALGDSHFFGRGTTECDATGQKNPSFVLEDPGFMQMFLPTLGVCPPNTIQVYRVFSNRPDANHRYMIDKVVRDQMVAKGWLSEGDGPDLVVMCAPQ